VLHEVGPDDRRVLDLGCGVGTAASYLAERREVDVLGVSISPTQVRLAEQYAARGRPLRGSVRFQVADFTALPEGVAGFDLAFSIEAFVHADPAAAYFREAARALRPGGALVVIDDVLTSTSDDPRLDRFREGWHVSALVSVDEASSAAAEAGLDLVASVDLSSWQRLGRPRDRLISFARPVLGALQGRWSWAGSLSGGAALQECHRAGLLEYRLLRFVRRRD
jgi:SAM-dependent methyltransferase